MLGATLVRYTPLVAPPSPPPSPTLPRREVECRDAPLTNGAKQFWHGYTPGGSTANKLKAKIIAIG